MTAVFQSEHLSLLLGTGISTGVCFEAGITPQAMQRINFITKKDEIKIFADNEEKKLARVNANFEDDLRTAIELLRGMRILNDSDADPLKSEINEKLKI